MDSCLQKGYWESSIPNKPRDNLGETEESRAGQREKMTYKEAAPEASVDPAGNLEPKLRKVGVAFISLIQPVLGHQSPLKRDVALGEIVPCS